MEGVYRWVGSLIGFFLFMSVLGNLLPGKKYEKYIRLFYGMVLILIVIQPLTGGLHLEEIMAHFYEAQMFSYETGDLKRQILDVEQQRLSQLIFRYEETAAENVYQMAEDMGLYVQNCRVDMAEDKENFGTVIQVWLQVKDGESTGEAREEQKAEEFLEPIEAVYPMEAMETISPIVIGKKAEEKEDEAVEKEDRKRRGNPTVERLRRKIASFYGLEEAYVEIQVVEG